MTFYCNSCKKYFSGDSPLCPFCNTNEDPNNQYKENPDVSTSDYEVCADESEPDYGYTPQLNFASNEPQYDDIDNQNKLIKQIIIYGAIADVFCFTVLAAVVGVVFAILCLVRVSQYKKLYGPLPAKLQFLYISCIIGIFFGTGLTMLFSCLYGSCVSTCSPYGDLLNTVGNSGNYYY